MDLAVGGRVVERTSVEKMGSVASARQLDARRQTQVECSFDAVLETSAAGGRRLIDALANGTREWVLSASDGSCTTRVRLRCAHAGHTQHQLGGNRLIVDWANATLERAGSRVTLSRTELRL